MPMGIQTQVKNCSLARPNRSRMPSIGVTTRIWRNFGAPETLLSYGVRPPRFDDETEFAKARDELAAMCPRSHLNFFAGLKNTYEEGDYLFVHAGVRPGVALHGRCLEVADALGIDSWWLSISHIETHAIASAIGVNSR